MIEGGTTRRFFMGLLGLASASAAIPFAKTATAAETASPIQHQTPVELEAHEAIEQELDGLRDYIRRRIGYTVEGGELAPDRWQLFSTYFRDLPANVRLTRENVVDLMGYLTILLAAARVDGDIRMNSVVVSTVGGSGGDGMPDHEEDE